MQSTQEFPPQHHKVKTYSRARTRLECNGGCSHASHVDMCMRKNTSVHLHGRNDLFLYNYTRSNYTHFASLSITSYPRESAAGYVRKKTAGFA